MKKKAVYDALAIKKLAESVLAHKIKYYKGQPEISDADFDRLEEELSRLAPNHPALAFIGSEVDDRSEKVAHAVPMLSLNKTYDLDDLKAWQKKSDVVGTIKIDGNSLSLIYKKGQMTLAKTRGNGREGENVTAKAHWVPSIVPSLPESCDMEVRGELYCTEADFVVLSDEMAALGLERPTSPRNIVAGILGRKTQIHLVSYFSFSAFEAIEEVDRFVTQIDMYDWLKNQGFLVPEPAHISTEKDLEAYLQFVKSEMASGDIGIDGAVFSYNDHELHRQLGNTAHHPRFKLSFKWQGETATSVIQRVHWNTSRLGIVTPVAVIAPAQLSGASIENITLHNAAHVRAYNIKGGDEIELVRSGEVIPKYLRTIKAAPGEYVWPKRCPTCAGQLEFDGVRLKCGNSDSCTAQQLGQILNWIRAVTIEDLSEKRLLPLWEKGLVRSIPDLYRLKLDDFYHIPQTKEKMATKLLKNIEASRQLPLALFLNGLGIEGTGVTTWEKILELFPTLESLFALKSDTLAEIDGFAEKSAEQIVSGLKSRRALIKEILKVGVKPLEGDASGSGAGAKGQLSGKVIVITGALSQPRPQVAKLIKDAGGKVSSSVSKNTHAVLTGDPEANSAKLTQAKKLGIQLWSEEDLRAILK